MINQLDEASYNEGRADFENGLSIRSIIERCMVAETAGPIDEAKALSRALGFADALIDKFRSL